jgi:four helix bundle protein
VKIEDYQWAGKICQLQHMDEKALKQRTKEFAHRCVKFSVTLPRTYLGNHIKGQLIRCSTSVASNYRAACIAQSRPSFISKLSIVLEEVDESHFWVEFVIDEQLLSKDRVLPLLKEAEELTAIFISSRKTARKEKSFIDNRTSKIDRSTDESIINLQSKIEN